MLRQRRKHSEFVDTCLVTREDDEGSNGRRGCSLRLQAPGGLKPGEDFGSRTAPTERANSSSCSCVSVMNLDMAIILR